jgi:HK97 gp10 family phage protein
MALKSNLGTFARGIAQAVDAGVEETAEQVKATRDPLTPVDTSALLKSGKVERQAQGVWIVSEGEGLPDARAIFTEYGTHKMAAQPHMTPAATQNASNLPKNVTKHLQDLERQSKV